MRWYKIVAEGGFQRSSFDRLECSDAVRLSFGAQKQDISHFSLIEAAREFIKMGHANHPDRFLQEGGYYLPGDL